MENKTFSSNGIKINYAKSGQGQPIIFVHGNMGSNKHFEKMHVFLSQNYTVYAPDTRSHGKSDKVKRLNYNDIANDIVALIEYEQMEKPIFFGFSDGGIVGLLIGIKHPNLLGKLFVAGVNLKWKGVKPGWRFSARLVFCLSLFGGLRDKMRLMMKQPEITADELEKIQTPTIVFYAEKDIVQLSHSQTVIDNVKGSRLVIVPKENHGSYILNNYKLAKLLAEYLKEKCE